MKKILFINTTSCIGGGPKVMFDLIKGLNNEYICVVITPSDGIYYERYKELNISVYAVSIRSLNPFVVFLVWKIIKREKPDIVHTHGKGAGIHGRIAAIFCRVLVVHTLHGIHVQEYDPIVRFFYSHIERLLSVFTRKIIAVSNSEQNKALRLGLFSQRRSYIIHNGIDENKLFLINTFRDTTRKALGISKDFFLIISVGRSVFPKNFQEFVHIIASIRANIPNLTAILVGDGDERKDIQELIEKNNMRDTVLLLGERDDVPELLAASDLYLSTSRWEGMPLSVLEAMATGLPIVVSRVTGNSDLIKDNENGMVYSLGNVKEASEKIMLLYKNKELRERLGNMAHTDAIQKYSIGRMVAAHHELYSSILNNYEDT